MSTPKQIVIIEDDPDLSAALVSILTDEGFTVKAAATGEDGVELVKSLKPDLLLLDMMLPGIDGLEVLEALKAYREETGMNVVILSNSDGRDPIHQAREYGVSDYLVKTDWRIDDVVKKIRKAL